MDSLKLLDGWETPFRSSKRLLIVHRESIWGMWLPQVRSFYRPLRSPLALWISTRDVVSMAVWMYMYTSLNECQVFKRVSRSKRGRQLRVNWVNMQADATSWINFSRHNQVYRFLMVECCTTTSLTERFNLQKLNEIRLSKMSRGWKGTLVIPSWVCPVKRAVSTPAAWPRCRFCSMSTWHA